jgi:hypothetical protein
LIYKNVIIPFTLYATLVNVRKFIPEFSTVFIHTHCLGIAPMSFNANVVHWTARDDTWTVCSSHVYEVRHNPPIFWPFVNPKPINYLMLCNRKTNLDSRLP